MTTKPMLYQWTTSCSAEKIRRALRHKGVAWDTVDINWFDRSVLVDLSRQNLVPILKHGDRVIGPRTMKIMEYIEQTFPGPSLFPDGTRGLCWLIDEYVEAKLLWLGCRAFLPAAAVKISDPVKRQSFEKDVIRMTGSSTEELIRDYPKLKEEYAPHLGFLDDHFSSRKFFVGEHMSAADHSLYSNYWFATNAPVWREIVESMKLKHLQAWVGRMKDFYFTEVAV